EVLAQSLMAAGRTVDPARRVHSLHSYFLKLGDPHVPVVYEVDRIRDGGSFTTRRVVAIQHGTAIFNMSASFHLDEEGPEHQDLVPPVPVVDTLPTTGPFGRNLGSGPFDGQVGPLVVDAFDFRHTGPFAADEQGGVTRPDQDAWCRAVGTLDHDPL